MEKLKVLETVETNLLKSYKEIVILLMDKLGDSYLFEQLLNKIKFFYELQNNILSSFTFSELQEIIYHFKYLEKIENFSLKSRITRLLLEQYIMTSNQDIEYHSNKDNASYHIISALKKVYQSIFCDDELKQIDPSFHEQLEKEFYPYVISIMIMNSRIEQVIINSAFDMTKCFISKIDRDFSAGSLQACKIFIVERSNNKKEKMTSKGVMEMLYIGHLFESHLNDLSQNDIEYLNDFVSFQIENFDNPYLKMFLEKLNGFTRK